MKYSILIGMVLTIGILLSFVSAQAIAPRIEIDLVNQKPYPAEPGKNVFLEIEIKNTGLETARDKVVELDVKEPFRLLPGIDKIKTFSIIGAGDSVKATYELAVDDKSISSDYTLDFKVYSSLDKKSYSTYPIKVRVNGKAKLVFEEVKTEPAELEPGSRVTLFVDIKNIGTGTAKQLQLEFNNTAILIPILDRGQAYLGDLLPGQTKGVYFEIGIDSSAEMKTYIAPIAAIYTEDGGEELTKDFSIGLPVTGSVLLDIINVEIEQEKAKLKVEIANKGTADANKIEARLLVDNKTVGVDYTSQLKPSKKATFSFPYVNGNSQLQLVYKVTGVGEKQITKDISFSDFRSGATGLVSGGSGISVAGSVLVLIILVVYVVFRRKKILGKLVHKDQDMDDDEEE